MHTSEATGLIGPAIRGIVVPHKLRVSYPGGRCDFDCAEGTFVNTVKCKDGSDSKQPNTSDHKLMRMAEDLKRRYDVNLGKNSFVRHLVGSVTVDAEGNCEEPVYQFKGVPPCLANLV